MLCKHFWTEEQHRQITETRFKKRKEALLELQRVVLSEKDHSITLQVLQKIANNVSYLQYYAIFDSN